MAGYSLYLERALQKILSDRDTRRSQNAKLKQLCEEALERLQTSVSDKSRRGDATAPSVSDVEHYYLVLEQVCKSRSPRLVSAALDCLQKLIAPGYLTGLSPDPDAPTRPLIDRIAETICFCFTGASTDEDVQLQIIKALLSMLTSTSCEVHEGSLLQVIRTCYNIYLASRKPINQATAKTTLTQIVHVVFQRMEEQGEESSSTGQTRHPSVATSSTPTPTTTTHVDRPGLSMASPVKSSSTMPSPSADSSVDLALAVPTEHEIMEEFAAGGLSNHSPYGSQELRASHGSSPGLLRAGMVRSNGSLTALSRSSLSASAQSRSEGSHPSVVKSVYSECVELIAPPGEEPTVEGTGDEGKTTPSVPARSSVVSDSPKTPTRSEDTTTEDPFPAAGSKEADAVAGDECAGDGSSELQDGIAPSSSDSVHDNRDDDSRSLSDEVKLILEEIVGKVCLDKEHPGVTEAKSSRPASRTMSPVPCNMTVVGPNAVAYVTGGGAGVSESPSATSLDSRSREDTAQAPMDTGWGFEHIAQKDAFLVFRSLCKLSMKAIETHDPRLPELRSKILSLELLLTVLDGAGPLLRTDPMFVNAIKQYLCVALSKNGVSSVPQVFELSLSIFLALLANFKDHLKMQIEVFFKEIFLNILQSTTSSFQHKLLVTNALKKICRDAQCIVNIYLNYDCDLSLANIFERLVGDIASIAQGSSAVVLGHPTPQQEKAIQFSGMECLVGILQSLVEWSRDLYVRPGGGTIASRTMGIETAFPLAREGGRLSPRPARQALPVVPLGGDQSREKADASSPVDSSSSSSVYSVQLLGNDLPEEYEVIKKRKDVVEEGLVKFHDKPRRGIKFLQEKELIGPEPADVAIFLLTDDRLDPVDIGEYLGEMDKFCIDVMYSYVDMLDFTEMPFVPALRMFLSGFRLPGEAQKIDRLMEKFAGRYCETNSGASVFASADTAYVLAYSIIMLATDLHSTKIKRESKMTKEQYIKMNRGINDQKDLPREYLESIYDEIAKQEITLRGGNKMKVPVQAGITDKTRQQLNDVEMEQMAQTAKAMMEDRSHIQTHFVIATRTEHARPMFKVAWAPFLPALSVALREDTGDESVVALCLEGFRAAIRVAAIFDAKLERSAFVQTLGKFTLLTRVSGVGEMKPKHIETAKILISIAHTEGNYLQDSWEDILNVVSRLELAQVVGNDRQRLKNSASAGHTPTQPNASSRTPGSSLDYLNNASAWQKVDSKTLDETISQTVIVAVDRIFTDSNLLDQNAILDFVKALVSVSYTELESRPAPRMFSLQKIVEISYYNMGRIRLEWSRIWAIIGEYFNKVGCHSNENVAVFAIDSLRQLSMKFLERGELANFRFQKDFLRPFEYIMKRNMSPTIRDMVVSCMAQMVHSHAGKIMSGWKNIFAVFHLAASDHDPQIVELAFETTSNIFEKHFAATIAASFQDAVKCLAEFSCNAAFPDTSMEAIRMIDLCAKCVAQQPQMFCDSATMEENLEAEDRVWVRGWFPVLFELSCIISRCKLDVRTRALTVMFNIMKTYGGRFASHWWRDVFNVIFRIFDNLKLPEQQLEKTEWMTTTCPHTLMCIVDVFSQYFEALAPLLLDNLYSQFSWSAQQDNKELAVASLDCLESFVTTNGCHFSHLYWDKTVDCVEKIFSATLPQALLTWRTEGSDETDSPYDVSFVHIHIPRKASLNDVVPSVSETMGVVRSTSSSVADTGRSSRASTCTNDSGGQITTVFEASENDPSARNGGSGRSSVVSEPGQPPAGFVPEVSGGLPASPYSAGVAAASDDSFTAFPRSDGGSTEGSEMNDSKTGSSGATDPHRVLGMLDVRCHVQRCLIRAVDHIVFSSVGSKHQDQRLFYAAAVEASHLPLPIASQGPVTANSSPRWPPTTETRSNAPSSSSSSNTGAPPSSGSSEAMFPLLSSAQLLRLVYLLMASHDFARLFNTDTEQRAALWKAGFQSKSKISMWKQETQSLLCVLRILFNMLPASQHASCRTAVEDTLVNIWQSTVSYYCTLVSANHRKEWLPVLLFLIDNLKRLEPIQFDRHLLQPGAKVLIHMVTVEMQPELRCVLRDLLEMIHSRACSLIQAAPSPS